MSIGNQSVLILFVAALNLRAADPNACTDMLSYRLSGGAITKAELVRTGSAPAYCRIAATLRPSSDSDIRMEIWLPAENWNGKLEANGNGGWTGSINPTALTAGVKRGYASAMSDLGHEGSRATFALGHPEKLVDFGYRAAHEMTVAAKAITFAYYKRAPAESYWTGCSAGGRSALMEAQRYPDDYDGIIAGAPGWNWTGRALQSIQIAQASHQNEAAYIPPPKYSMIHDAVLRACDTLDGLKDGVLEDPTRCNFDPKQLECRGPDAPTCLTSAQVETAHVIYEPVRDRRTRALIFPGFERGSELGWSRLAGPQPFEIGLDLFKYVVFKNPDWNYRAFNFGTDLDLTAKAERGILNASDPDLRPFFRRGGKLIQYHGWSDPQIAPGISVEYYKSILSASQNASAVSESYRLFMVPGMAHCGGGDGVSTFDALNALEAWVEHGKAPAQIPATRVENGRVERSRPLCPILRLRGTRAPGIRTTLLISFVRLLRTSRVCDVSAGAAVPGIEAHQRQC
ncbi:MAG: tannase/feruloyl esterase family alpha/beta hydrolase [Bryobacteraceae bacterium]